MRIKRIGIVVLAICILFAFTSCKNKDTSKSDNKNGANNTATESPTEIIDIDLSDDNDTATDSNTETPTESTTIASTATLSGKYMAVQDVTSDPALRNYFDFKDDKVNVQINLLETIISFDVNYEYDPNTYVVVLGEGVYDAAGDSYNIFSPGVMLYLGDNSQSLTVQGMNDHWVLQGWNPNCFADGSVFAK